MEVGSSKVRRVASSQNGKSGYAATLFRVVYGFTTSAISSIYSVVGNKSRALAAFETRAGAS
jgi:hypothetical protein